MINTNEIFFYTFFLLYMNNMSNIICFEKLNINFEFSHRSRLLLSFFSLWLVLVLFVIDLTYLVMSFDIHKMYKVCNYFVIYKLL